MIDFYVTSAVRGRKIMETTAPQIVDKLERVIRAWETDWGVQVQDEKILGLDSKTLQMWFNAASANWKPATLNNYVCILNPFLHWAFLMKNNDVPYITDDLSQVLHTVKIPSPDDLPEEERPRNKYYTQEQVQALLYEVKGRNAVRDRAIIALILGSGIRVSELCSLTIGKFAESQQGTVKVRRKGGAYKNVDIADFVYPLVEAYLQTRHDRDDLSQPLFITTHGNPCTRESIYKALSFKQKSLDLATGPHALRHTFLSEAEKQSSISVVRDLANHKSFGTTTRYTHSSEAQRHAAVNALPWCR